MSVQGSRAEPRCTEGSSGSAAGAAAARGRAAKCPCCGRHAIRLVAQPGRMCRYRNAALTLPADLQVPTCRRCKHMLLSFELVPELAMALEATYRAELIQRAVAEISRLGRVYSQRYIEVIVDLSQGYLSRLRAGDGVPSAALVSLMALLAADPSRMEELKRYWALPLSNQALMDQGKSAHDIPR